MPICYGYAQDSWNSLGADLENPTGKISCSIGQVFTENVNSAGYIQFQGVQIPFLNSDLFVQTISDTDLIVFPNPASNVLNVKASTSFHVLSIRDLSGRVVLEINASTLNSSQIELSNLSNGAYFLEVNIQETLHSIPFIKN